MNILITDPHLSEKLLQDRQAWGGDKYDEVWEGMYTMNPIPNVEHQSLVGSLTTKLTLALGDTALVLPGVNVSDRHDDWTQNYRCPDVAVYLPGNPAENRDTHFLGGPDFGVEIISPQDRAREKLDFYAATGTRELLIVDRYPWRLELYRLTGRTLTLSGTVLGEQEQPLKSETLSLGISLIPGSPRPQIQLEHSSREKSWLI